MRDWSPDRPPPARKSLGQHFLHDRRVLEAIADALRIDAGTTVVEIGPGRGVLTDVLAERAGAVVAIEVDRALVPILRDRYANRRHVRIVEADVLETDLHALAGGDFVLAGNVPYYITTPILFHALAAPRPVRAVFLVQKEVAERVVATPGSKAYGALSVNVQTVAKGQIVMRVPPGAFRPPPKVDSAVLVVEPLAEPMISAAEEERFRSFVQQVFGMRRKQLRRVLRGVVSIDAAEADAMLTALDIDPEARPETLSPSQFVLLSRAVRARA